MTAPNHLFLPAAHRFQWLIAMVFVCISCSSKGGSDTKSQGKPMAHAGESMAAQSAGSMSAAVMGKPSVGKGPRAAEKTAQYTVKRVVVAVARWGKIYRENTYILSDNSSRDAVIIDPGKAHPDIEAHIKSSSLKVRAILNTHGHFDHIQANDHYRKLYGVKVYAHKVDRHFYGKARAPDKPDVLLDKEKHLSFGTLHLRIIAVPGHSRGSLFFLCGAHLFSGDTLFLENLGMTFTDKKATSAQKMMQQIRG
ncbi:MBL fold metallo-hydrolase, partial [Myxococcota bacterium]|nr:MBL fold metallo-hydrolase [Myxococcota bacterium]